MGSFAQSKKSSFKKRGGPPYSVSGLFVRVLIGQWLVSPWAWAGETGEQIGTHVLKPGDYLGQMVLSLGVVLLLIFAAAWLLRRFSQLPGIKGQHIQVLSAIAVGRQEKLLLVQVGKQQMLIGVTPSKITLLQTLAEPIELADNEQYAPVKMPFSKWLQDALKQAPRQ